MKKLLLILLLIPSLAFSQARVRNNPLSAGDTILFIDTGIVQSLKSIYSLPLALKITSQNDKAYWKEVTATSSLGITGAYSKFKITRGVGESSPKYFPENDLVDLFSSRVILNGSPVPATKFITSDSTIKAAQLPQIDLASKVTGVLPAANGGIATGAAAMSATTGAVTVSMATAETTVTPTGNMTWNFSAGTVAGQFRFIKVTTSGVTSFTMTPGTGVKSAALATGTTTAKVFKIGYYWDGTVWQEFGRTAAQ